MAGRKGALQPLPTTGTSAGPDLAARSEPGPGGWRPPSRSRRAFRPPGRL